MKFVKKYMPAVFKDDKDAANDCSFISEEILFPEKQKQEFRHKPLRKVSEYNE